ncbi:MAG TPA: LytR C-terminal domain-containing protein [Actinomycetota bacterium]|nr:LytR C-terminal domain-containing protein [Actinomycetota bacterium]
MNLGTWRIAIIVALVVVGVAVLANGFDPAEMAVGTSPSVASSPDDGAAEPGATATETDGVEPTGQPEETPPPNESDVPVKVFNGTTVPGLAALVQEELVNGGNTAPEDPANAPVLDVAKTTVYFRGGPDAAQNEADATFIAETYIEPVLGKMPRIDELSSVYDDVVGSTVTVVVLIGDDYAANLDAAG